MLQSRVGYILLLGATQIIFVEHSEFFQDERNYTNIEMLCCGGETVELLMLTKILLHVEPAAGSFKLLAKFILSLLWSPWDGALHAATRKGQQD